MYSIFEGDVRFAYITLYNENNEFTGLVIIIIHYFATMVYTATSHMFLFGPTQYLVDYM